MTATEWYLVGLRLVHVLASVVWLGGGVYYLIAMRPALRAADDPPTAFVSAAQQHFGEWARVCTLAMLATGAVLVFERLSEQGSDLVYVVLMVAKVLAALAAFWLAGMRPRRGGARSSGRSRSKPETIVTLGFFAFAMGVIISTGWGDR